MKKKIVIEGTCGKCPYLSWNNSGKWKGKTKWESTGYFCGQIGLTKSKLSSTTPTISEECPLEDEIKVSAIWFKKGRESVLRDNPSGCCCLFDEKDNLVSICNAHKQWVEDHK